MVYGPLLPRGQGAGPLGTPPIGLLDLYRKAIGYGALPRPYIVSYLEGEGATSDRPQRPTI